MTWLIAGPLIAAVVLTLAWLSRGPWRLTLISELPGLLFILAAGKPYRAQARQIMASRARAAAAGPPKPRPSGGSGVIRLSPRDLGAQMNAVACACEQRHATSCRRCGNDEPWARGLCRECYWLPARSAGL